MEKAPVADENGIDFFAVSGAPAGSAPMFCICAGCWDLKKNVDDI
jgi:hypothetical protein